MPGLKFAGLDGGGTVDLRHWGHRLGLVKPASRISMVVDCTTTIERLGRGSAISFTETQIGPAIAEATEPWSDSSG